MPLTSPSTTAVALRRYGWTARGRVGQGTRWNQGRHGVGDGSAPVLYGGGPRDGRLGRRRGVRTGAAPNFAVEPTPNSLRSCLAAALGRGSPPALGFQSAE